MPLLHAHLTILSPASITNHFPFFALKQFSTIRPISNISILLAKFIVGVKFQLVFGAEVNKAVILPRGEDSFNGGDGDESLTVPLCAFYEIVVLTHVLLHVAFQAILTKGVLAFLLNVVGNYGIADIA